MRFLNTHTSQLEDFAGGRIPPYVILSHRWQHEEVLYEDWISGRAHEKAGFAKLEGARKEAAARGFEYIWADTFCIDKRSSSELSEAINSMYNWYQNAEVCYAYLVDVPDPEENGIVTHNDTFFAQSEWFRRGWTLQELIAPRQMLFFSQGWVEIGSKDSLQHTISAITGIEVGVLTSKTDLHSVSVAKRMSWAANRKTTRIEDTAYCLMGLFNVNMPMIYGEGSKAFIRLQEEIIRNSDDESLFAWINPEAMADTLYGLLATSPRQFAHCSEVISYQTWNRQLPFSKTNKGFRISLPLNFVKGDVFLAALNCYVPGKNQSNIGIYLKQLGQSASDNWEGPYARINTNKLATLNRRGGNIRHLYVLQQNINTPTSENSYLEYTDNKCLKRDENSSSEHVLKIDKNIRFRGSNQGGEAYSSLLALQSEHNKFFFRSESAATFNLDKRYGHLVAVTVFQRRNKTRFAVLFGSTIDHVVAVQFIHNFCELLDMSFPALEKTFEPHPPGHNVVLGGEQFRVDIRTYMRGYTKISHATISVTVVDESKVPGDQAGPNEPIQRHEELSVPDGQYKPNEPASPQEDEETSGSWRDFCCL